MTLNLTVNSTFKLRVQWWVKLPLLSMQIYVWLHLKELYPYLSPILILMDTRTESDTPWYPQHHHHRSITFKATISLTEINFLDTTVYKGLEFSQTGKHDIKVYSKPIDIHQLLHKPSCHSKHSFRGIIRSQISRFHSICTRTSALMAAVNTTHVPELFILFSPKNYRTHSLWAYL